MGILSQEYWSGFSLPPPRDLPNPGIEPRSPTLLADALASEPPGKPKQGYWSVLANTDCHTIFPATLAANPPEYLVLPEPLRPKQLHHLHTWPSQGQTQVLQGSLRSKPQWTTPM